MNLLHVGFDPCEYICLTFVHLDKFGISFRPCETIFLVVQYQAYALKEVSVYLHFFFVFYNFYIANVPMVIEKFLTLTESVRL